MAKLRIAKMLIMLLIAFCAFGQKVECVSKCNINLGGIGKDIPKGEVINGDMLNGHIVFKRNNQDYYLPADYFDIKEKRCVDLEVQKLIKERRQSLNCGWGFFLAGAAFTVSGAYIANNNSSTALYSTAAICYTSATIAFCRAAYFSNKINDKLLVSSNLSSVKITF